MQTGEKNESNGVFPKLKTNKEMFGFEFWAFIQDGSNFV